MTYISRVLASLCLFLAIACAGWPALAQDQKVVVTVNDRPITSNDLKVRQNLWKLIGVRRTGNLRKAALNDIINDIAKLEEARKYNQGPNKKDINERMMRVAKTLGTDEKGLAQKLRSNGISESGMTTYLAGQVSFARLLSGKYKEKLAVSPAEVDAEFNAIKAQMNGQLNKIKSDPRMQPVTVYQILEIKFPIDSDDMLQSRAVEAQQYQSRFKGCKSARAAASGIFNVQIGKSVEADSRKIPGQMKSAFNAAGVGRAVGPFRSGNGLQLWGFCGTRKIVPQMPTVKLPTRDQVQNSLMGKRYEALEKKYAPEMRKGLLIEYRDSSLAP